MLSNAEAIEKVFNETFVPASELEFLPISCNVVTPNQDDNLNDGRFNVAEESPVNCREIFFVHRSVVPDPDEVIFNNLSRVDFN